MIKIKKKLKNESYASSVQINNVSKTLKNIILVCVFLILIALTVTVIYSRKNDFNGIINRFSSDKKNVENSDQHKVAFESEWKKSSLEVLFTHEGARVIEETIKCEQNKTNSRDDLWVGYDSRNDVSENSTVSPSIQRLRDEDRIGCIPEVDVYYTGAITSGRFKGLNIFYLVLGEGGSNDSYSIYRFVKSGNRTIFLPRYSDDIHPSYEKAFSFQQYISPEVEIEIPELEAPDKIDYPKYSASLVKEKVGPRRYLTLSRNELEKSDAAILQSAENGQYSFYVQPDNVHFYVMLMPDGTIERYKVEYNFFNDSDRIGLGSFNLEERKYQYSLSRVNYSEIEGLVPCKWHRTEYRLYCREKGTGNVYAEIYWLTPFNYYIKFKLLGSTSYYQNSTSSQRGSGGVDNMLWGKPVIYLYPSKTTDVFVQVKPAGGLTISDPEYGEGWQVQAKPNGEIFNYADGKNYPYLFWEGESQNYDIGNQGALVEKENVKKFLQESLEKQGLVKKEIDDFMDFWLPRMQAKDYYQIYFISQNEFDRMAPLSIEPSPDKIIRVLMDYRGVDEPIETVPQNFTRPAREGFTVVEWGGILH